ncbi:MAG: hypothetical protein ACOY3P_24215 [Planctomycetota bacterium]
MNAMPCICGQEPRYDTHVDRMVCGGILTDFPVVRVECPCGFAGPYCEDEQSADFHWKRLMVVLSAEEFKLQQLHHLNLAKQSATKYERGQE